MRPDGRAADVFRLWPLFIEQGDCQPIYEQASDGSDLIVGVETENWSCVIEVGSATADGGARMKKPFSSRCTICSTGGLGPHLGHENCSRKEEQRP